MSSQLLASRRLDADFFDRSVHEVARDLIGCALLFDGVGGVIVECESYERDDPACHAYVGLTARTEPLFGPPGRAYVYLSYGVHPCSTSSASRRAGPPRCWSGRSSRAGGSRRCHVVAVATVRASCARGRAS